MSDMQVTVSNCEKEQIHIPGAVQSFGVLIAINDQFIIQHVSQNSSDFFNTPASDVLGKPLSFLFPYAEQVEKIEKAIVDKNNKFNNPYDLTMRTKSGDTRWECFIHRKGTQLILEIEPYLLDVEHEYGFNKALKSSLSAIQDAKSLEELCQITAKEIQQISQYDRVMIYRFDKDWNGEVVAEALSSGSTDSYMGHRFPASDIPPQARAIFFK